MTPKDFKIGQEICFVRNGWRRTEPKKIERHIVTMVGRIWVTTCKIGNEKHEHMRERFAPQDTMCADGKGYSSLGKYYLTEQDYHDETARDEALYELRRFFDACGAIATTVSMPRLKEILAELRGEKNG